MFPFVPLRDRIAQLAEFGCDPVYWPRVALALGLSGASLPFRVYESLRYGRALAATQVHPEPLFVLGCARSGTTHLHNLLAQDARFGHVTNFQVLAQPFALSGARWLRPLLARLGTATRATDNVRLELDGPQEEDLAVAAASRHSMLHSLSFPRAYAEHQSRYMFLELTPEQRAAWEAAYLGVLRKATLACGGLPLVLKSPTNTARVPTLRRLFPRARFVHIHRDPYDVFRSVAAAYAAVLPVEQVQRIDLCRVEDDFVESYRLLMGRFLEQRDQLPADQFVELSFAELERDPVGALEQVYAALGLPGWEAARPRVDAYLERLGRYEKNPPALSDQLVRRVNAEWTFALESLGYPRREPSGVPP